MTPGAAKTRAELPWLYYPENPRVIINAHNFGGGAFSPAVNGKMPVAAWIPSRDGAGNGTTTLTDLVGSNNGTLINMDAATDWVADTDSSGVRALDFDGSNDYISMASGFDVNVPAEFSISAWLKVRSFALFGSATILTIGTADFGAVAFGLLDRRVSLLCSINGSTWLSLNFGGAQQPVDTWLHLCVIHTNTGLYTGYVNGAAIGSFTNTSPLILNNTSVKSGAHYALNSSYMLNGRVDDIRIFDQAVDATDIAALATGRGVNVA